MPRYSYLLIAIIVFGVVAMAPISTIYAAVPSGFSQSATLVTVSQPTAMAFSADNALLFVTEKTGKLRLVDIATDARLTLRSAAVLDLTTRICSNSERGLLGIALDPQFAFNRYFYLYYTYKWANTCIDNAPSSPVNRVSRFTLAANGIADLTSERILIDKMPSPNGNHNGGDLHFGNDSYLYISIGDGGCDYAGGGCGGTNDATRDLNVLTGKILRIIANPDLTPAQRIPASNPFAALGASCAVQGSTTAGTRCTETFAYGLRNPFRMAFDPNITGKTTLFYINDVGQGIWEEVDRGELGADYRWNFCEGSYINGTRTLCVAPQGVQRNPIHEYDHNGTGTAGCNSITGGVIVPNGVWPATHARTYLFADYVCGKIFQIDPNAPANRVTFGSSLGAIVDMAFGLGPAGSQALYYARIDTGSIHRIWPTGIGNSAPTAVLSASPQFGDVHVTFDGSESIDPNGDALTYLWDFGNGTTQTTSTNTTSYTYPIGGRYTALLQVRDTSGALSNAATLLIDTENNPPVITINQPVLGATFGVGDSITLQASANDDRDGNLPNTAFRWEVVLHHRAGQVGAHTHPFFGPQSGNSLTFTAPAPEDFDAASNSYLELRVTATDNDGASTTISRDLLPGKVPLLLTTIPSGLKVSINGTQIADQQASISWRGYRLNLIAYPQLDATGHWVALSSWENSATSSARTVTTPSSTTTYTATFGRPASVSWNSWVKKP